MNSNIGNIALQSSSSSFARRAPSSREQVEQPNPMTEIVRMHLPLSGQENQAVMTPRNSVPDLHSLRNTTDNTSSERNLFVEVSAVRVFIEKSTYDFLRRGNSFNNPTEIAIFVEAYYPEERSYATKILKIIMHNQRNQGINNHIHGMSEINSLLIIKEIVRLDVNKKIKLEDLSKTISLQELGWIAVKNNCPYLLRLLLDSNAIDPHLMKDGTPMLMLAERYQAGDIVKLLLEADSSFTDAQGDRFAYLAAEKGNVGLLKTLLPRLSTLMLKDLLNRAIVHGRAGIVQTIFERMSQADRLKFLNERDVYGKTPLMLAACYGRADIAQIFIDHGADVMSQDNEGMTALMWAVSSRRIPLPLLRSIDLGLPVVHFLMDALQLKKQRIW